ncbi:hypothetical protein [Coraliomargarita akajimensis]|uniref:Uncharacterized protein n=1 Tax=Coraliomargarita akajimensis (strain DSM 45221 / IAM 15411 / JCM 23193 / KCTC 12865 / 04OKA010-24) TaxID=583355 RepID=D5EKZ7_CORAD|nr:hypothetical protein [Coraliomargarita akajimensis]ADE53099.1 hypothetical protein Caka_0070 [Coraliomargarita akajimensis DSM 45221]
MSQSKQFTILTLSLLIVISAGLFIRMQRGDESTEPTAEIAQESAAPRVGLQSTQAPADHAAQQPHTDTQNSVSAAVDPAQLRSYEAVEAYVLERYDRDKAGLFSDLVAGIPDFNYEAAASAITHKMVQTGDWETEQPYLEQAALSPDLGSYLLPAVISAFLEQDYQTVKTWILDQSGGYGIVQSANKVGLWSVGSGYTLSTESLLTDLDIQNPSHEAFFKGYIEGLTHWEFEAAGALLQAMESGPRMDLAIYEYLKFARNLEVDVSMQWAESITDPSLRRGAVLDLAAEWETSDAKSYTAWLSNSELEPALKQELLDRSSSGQ